VNKTALAYKPIGVAVGLAGGAITAAVFKQVWKLVSDKDSPPNPMSTDYSWAEILAAAAVQGAIFGVVRAVIERGGAAGVRRITGTWPD